MEMIFTLLYNTIKYTIKLTITVKTRTRNTTNTKGKSWDYAVILREKKGLLCQCTSKPTMLG